MFFYLDLLTLLYLSISSKPLKSALEQLELYQHTDQIFLLLTITRVGLNRAVTQYLTFKLTTRLGI